ncbi:universal stress protein [Consotaella salsifontis]|uniref:Nucleotide-binding universal stress protein, UspA family n=1 Tax=Consotaella salsifontis TaxID=1365950 RepID=A0A1T4SX05_9HYPH|nr:universal stress protein [Consotaella salsifontis]SKA32743.1 Nucleotide-binding universal stress protein, UspA family [Consotaella salsifontis]
MRFKTVLSVVGVSHSLKDVELAKDLCREIGAHLSILVVSVASPPPIGEYAAIVSEDWLYDRRAEMTTLREKVSDIKDLMGKTDVSFDVDGVYPELISTAHSVGHRARFSDVVVLGPAYAIDEQLRTNVLDGVLFEAQRPVLVVPEGGHPTLKPKTVMVAWAAGLEATRATRESLDLLCDADMVSITLVDPDASSRDTSADPGSDVAAYLARHGAKVRVDRLPSSGRPVSDTLNQQAIDISADLIVMGAYGHSRLRERLFGGVTRAMIEDPRVPLLLAR